MYQFAKSSNLPINNKLFQKYISYHVKTIPADYVYANVGNDYSLLRLKNVPSHSIDVNTFLFICENGLNQQLDTKSLPVFSTFVDTCLPPRPATEQPWQTLTRADKWKDRALFIALSFYGTPEFMDVESKLFPKKVPTRYDQFNKKDLAKEISELITLISVDEEMIAEKFPPGETLGPNLGSNVGPKLVPKLGLDLVSHVKKEFALGDLEPFRRRSGLVATFDTTKLVKQFILSSIGVVVPPDASILSKKQKELVPLVQDEYQLVSDLIDACEFKIMSQELEVLKKFGKISNKKNWTPHLLLKSSLEPEKYLNSLESERLKRINKDQDGLIELVMSIDSVLVK